MISFATLLLGDSGERNLALKEDAALASSLAH
jgi:hypothetical protein